MKAYWRSGGIAPRILDLGTRFRWVVSFTPQSLYSPRKERRYPLDTSLGGTQSRSGWGGDYEFGKTRSWPIWRYCHGICPEGRREISLRTGALLSGFKPTRAHDKEIFVRGADLRKNFSLKSFQLFGCSRKSFDFLETYGSLPYSRKPVTWPYCEQVESSPHHTIVK
jgi:hypothetical protein